MRGTSQQIARALAKGPFEQALARVFVDCLGWQRADGAIAHRDGVRVVAGAGSEGDVFARDLGNAIELTWCHGGIRYRLPIDRMHPSRSALAKLAALRAVPVVREGGSDSGFAECFDPKAIAAEFLEDYRAMFDRHVTRIATWHGKKLGEVESRDVLNRFLLRVFLVAFIQSRDWLSFRGRSDYLQALFEDWKREPGPHLFQQRLALVFFNALDEPRPDARRLLEPQIGVVPHIGGGLFTPEQHETELGTEQGPAILPLDLFEDLFSDEGLLRRYEFSVCESVEGEAVVAVTPESLGAVFAAFVSGEASPVYEDTASHRIACRRTVAAHLGAEEPLDLPVSAHRAREWREKLRGLHVHDAKCGAGTRLVASLEELAALIAVLEGGGKSSLKRRIASENLRGLDEDVIAVSVARFRIALAILAGDPVPRQLPDLRQIVRRGGELPLSRRMPPEGPGVEHKASFDWDPRKGQGSAEMRFGSLRTVAAFLNSEGGVLYLGVDDRCVPVGLEGDFALTNDASPRDAFENRFREFMKNSLDPLPLNDVSLSFDDFGGKTVCLVTVSPAAGVTYLAYKDTSGRAQESVFVRDGNRTIELKGRARDAFVVSRL